MKRITIIFTPTGSPVDLALFRGEIEGVLLRLHPKITYKINRVDKQADGKILAEITLDGKLELLDAALKQKHWQQPVVDERMGWGWPFSPAEKASLQAGIPSYSLDPLAGISPAEGMLDAQLGKLMLWLRFVGVIVLTILLILLMIFYSRSAGSILFDGALLISFSVWMILLNGTPIDMRVYARQITLGEAGLELKYWFMNKTINLAWGNIRRLVCTEPVCILFAEGQRVRFLLSERFGCSKKAKVLKTIIARANLNYVGGNFRKQEYSVFDTKI